MAVVDYCSGYEVFGRYDFALARGSGEATVRVFEGFVHRLMSLIEESSSGWQGIALCYHTSRPWEDAPWHDPSPSHTLALLRDVESRVPADDVVLAAVCRSLIDLYTASVQHGVDVVVSFE